MKIIGLLTSLLLVALSIGFSSCNNQVKSSDLEDRVENGKYIVYKKGETVHSQAFLYQLEILI